MSAIHDLAPRGPDIASEVLSKKQLSPQRTMSGLPEDPRIHASKTSLVEFEVIEEAGLGDVEEGGKDESGEVPAASGEAPAASGEAPVVSGEAPVVSGEAPVVSGEAPVVSGEVPVAGDSSEKEEEEKEEEDEEHNSTEKEEEQQEEKVCRYGD